MSRESDPAESRCALRVCENPEPETVRPAVLRYLAGLIAAYRDRLVWVKDESVRAWLTGRVRDLTTELAQAQAVGDDANLVVRSWARFLP